MMPEREPVEVTWGPDGIEVIYAVEREWTAERRKDFDAWATVRPK